MLNLLILSGIVVLAGVVTALIVIADRPRTRVYDIDGASIILALKVKR